MSLFPGIISTHIPRNHFDTYPQESFRHISPRIISTHIPGIISTHIPWNYFDTYSQESFRLNPKNYFNTSPQESFRHISPGIISTHIPRNHFDTYSQESFRHISPEIISTHLSRNHFDSSPQESFRHISPEIIPTNLPRNHFNTSPQAVEQISDARELANNMTSDIDLHVLRHDMYGKGFLKTCNVSPDACIQLALQLAQYKVIRDLSHIGGGSRFAHFISFFQNGYGYRWTK